MDQGGDGTDGGAGSEDEEQDEGELPVLETIHGMRSRARNWAVEENCVSGPGSGAWLMKKIPPQRMTAQETHAAVEIKPGKPSMGNREGSRAQAVVRTRSVKPAGGWWGNAA